MNEDAAPRDAADAVAGDGAGEAAGEAGAVATEAAGAGGAPEGEWAGGGAAEAGALRAELDALNDRFLRLAAEFDNYRKRNERERGELWVRAQAELAARLLDALDDLQRVAAFGEETTGVAALLEGVRLVEKKLRQALESAGLAAIEAAGERFDPATMEALMTVPAERPEDDERVADVFQKGYRFGGTLIRPARVRVLKHDPAE